MIHIPIEEKFGWYKTGRAGTKFCQVYDEAVGAVLKTNSSVALRLLFWVMKKMDSSNIVRLRGGEKRDFIYECGGGISISAVNRGVQVLVAEGIMIPTSVAGNRGGEYFVNPYLFWKENSQIDRKQRIIEFHDLLNLKEYEEN